MGREDLYMGVISFKRMDNGFGNEVRFYEECEKDDFSREVLSRIGDIEQSAWLGRNITREKLLEALR